jgi:hypothetical protein
VVVANDSASAAKQKRPVVSLNGREPDVFDISMFGIDGEA